MRLASGFLPSKAILGVINDLLDVAKIEAGRMEIEPHLLEVHKTFDTALKIIGAKARELLGG